MSGNGATGEPAGIGEPDGDGRAGHEPAPEPGPPVPLVLSCGLGAVGLVLLVIGAALGNSAVSVAGVLAGSLSLGAALYWRSLLISAWHQQRGRPPR